MGIKAPERDRNGESPSSDSSDEDLLSLVQEDVVPGEVDGDLEELDQQLAASEDHIANLEGELKEATDQEAETAQRLDSERQRIAALDQQLHEARKETTIRMLHKASQTRNTIVAGAEELLQASRVQAENEAVAIVDAGRKQARALEDDAAQRMADLDTEHRKLTHRLSMMETMYGGLRETLKVAETSLNEFVEAQESLKQLDPAATQGPPSESTADQATDSGTEEGSVADQEAPSGLESVEPAPIEVRPLPGR